MSFSQWTVNKSNPANVEVGINTISPILSTGSLRIKDNASEAVQMYKTTYTNGLIRGRMRMLMRYNTTPSGISNYESGFYFNGSVTNLLTSGNFYSAGIRATNAGNTHVYYIGVHNSGTGLSLSDPIYSYVSATVTPFSNGTTILPLEIEWHTETAELAGVRMILRGNTTGNTLTDFSNLTTLATMIIATPSQVLSTSVSEGIFFSGLASSGLEIYYDAVSIYKLT